MLLTHCIHSTHCNHLLTHLHTHTHILHLYTHSFLSCSKVTYKSMSTEFTDSEQFTQHRGREPKLHSYICCSKVNYFSMSTKNRIGITTFDNTFTFRHWIVNKGLQMQFVMNTIARSEKAHLSQSRKIETIIRMMLHSVINCQVVSSIHPEEWLVSEIVDISQSKGCSRSLILILLMIGGVETNPGPDSIKKAERQARYRRKKALEIAEKMAIYRLKNAPAIAKEQASRRLRNALVIVEKNANYRKENAQVIKEKKSNYYKKNSQEKAIYRKENASVIAVKKALYLEKKKERQNIHRRMLKARKLIDNRMKKSRLIFRLTKSYKEVKTIEIKNKKNLTKVLKKSFDTVSELYEKGIGMRNFMNTELKKIVKPIQKYFESSEEKGLLSYWGTKMYHSFTNEHFSFDRTKAEYVPIDQLKNHDFMYTDCQPGCTCYKLANCDDNIQNVEPIKVDDDDDERETNKQNDIDEFDQLMLTDSQTDLTCDEITNFHDQDEADKEVLTTVLIDDKFNVEIVALNKVDDDETEKQNDIEPKKLVRLCNSAEIDDCPSKDEQLVIAERIHNAIEGLNSQMSVSIIRNTMANFQSCRGYHSDDRNCNGQADCTDKLALIKTAAVHSSRLRTLIRNMYRLRAICNWLTAYELAIVEGKWETFKDMFSSIPHKLASLYTDIVFIQSENEYSETVVLAKHGKKIKKFRSEIRKFKLHRCDICKNLKYDSDLKVWEEWDGINFANDSVMDPIVDNYTLPCTVCKICTTYLFSKGVPNMASINGLEVSDLPSELSQLNMYERLLTQRAKCFMQVIKLMPYRFKGPPSNFVKSIKGIAIHLPLPMVNTVNYTMSTMPSIEDGMLEIIVDSLPNKKNSFGAHWLTWKK